jgi:hypothetical protein
MALDCIETDKYFTVEVMRNLHTQELEPFGQEQATKNYQKLSVDFLQDL